MITIEQLKELNKIENIAVSEHARTRLYERNISIWENDFETRFTQEISIVNYSSAA